jgi:hypothetical protein
VASLFEALFSVAFGIGTWWLFGHMLTLLAPWFGGRRDESGANKTATYTLTALLVSGAFALCNSLPYLGFMSWLGQLAGLGWGIATGIWGLPLLMGTPTERAPAHLLTALGATALAIGGVGFALTLLGAGALFGSIF